MARVVFRIFSTNPPSERDLSTYLELGIVTEFDDPDAVEMASGYSVFRDEAYARRVSRRMPWKGSGFIARLELPDRIDVRLRQTGGNPRHYTLWCSRDVLLESVVEIHPTRDQ